jgi:hypothetical protein
MDWIDPGIVEAYANVAEQESSSNEELEKSLTAFVNISDEGEMSKVCDADLSAYSWIIDSGVMTHICANIEAFATYQSAPRKVVKGLGNKPVIARGQGTVLLRACIDDEQHTLCLTRVLYVPEACQNLISVGRIRDNAGGRVVCNGGQTRTCSR